MHTYYPKYNTHIHTHLTVNHVKKYNCVDKWQKPLCPLVLNLPIFSQFYVDNYLCYLFHPQFVINLWIFVHSLCLFFRIHGDIVYN